MISHLKDLFEKKNEIKINFSFLTNKRQEIKEYAEIGDENAINVSVIIDNAEKGDSGALYQLARILQNGLLDVEKDIKNASLVYYWAAYRGHADAAFELGKMIELGHAHAADADAAFELEKDFCPFSDAIFSYEIAARKNHMLAKRSILDLKRINKRVKVNLNSNNFDLNLSCLQGAIKLYNFYVSDEHIGEYAGMSQLCNYWQNPTGEFEFGNSFKLVSDGKVVYDEITGLFWQRDISPYYMSYDMINNYLAELNERQFGEYGDWRLPTVAEAMSLVTRINRSGGVHSDPIFANSYSIWTKSYLPVEEQDWKHVKLNPEILEKYQLFHPQEDHVWIVEYMKGRCYPANRDNNLSVRVVRSLISEENSVDKRWDGTERMKKKIPGLFRKNNEMLKIIMMYIKLITRVSY